MPLPPLVEPASELALEEIRRYARHLVTPGVGEVGQRRLKRASVLCVGAGGLGSPVLMYLAAAGIGTLGIAEYDTVDESNLQRQVIHGHSDVGRSKASSAADSIREINPNVDVVLHDGQLTEENAEVVVSKYDLIVDCSDNFDTRYLINDTAVRFGKPCVWGSVLQFGGQAAVFWAEHGPCYRCLFPEPPPERLEMSCAARGIVGATCAVVGSIQATETIKLITGAGEPLIGSVIVYDGSAMTFRKILIKRDPACPSCQ